jgi:hypothetical protein
VADQLGEAIGSSEAELLFAVRERDPAALDDIWERSGPAAHAVARRVLGPGRLVERVLESLYSTLWHDPPAQPLERWVRATCLELATAALLPVGRPPAAPSLALALGQSPRPGGIVEPVERVLARLDHAALLALVRAHDHGVPSAEQPDPLAPRALDRAMAALTDLHPADEPQCWRLADLALGLLDERDATDLEASVAAHEALDRRLRALREARRRLEGLPPAPDLGPRVLLRVRGGPQPIEPLVSPALTAPEPPPEEIVIRVARRPEPSRLAPSELDTGPIDVPPQAASSGARETAQDEPVASQRGLGLLLLATALGLLAGALAQALT